MPIIKNRIPNAGNVKDMMQRLQSYIEPVDPEWSKRLRPASEENIKKWKNGLGLKEKGLDFPSSFLHFLRCAGETDGGLFEETLNAQMSVESQLLNHRSIYRRDGDRSQPFCLDFSMTIDMNMPYSIDLGKENEKVFCDGVIEISGCFENLLFQCAVEIYERLYFPLCETIRPGRRYADVDYAKQGRNLFLAVNRIAKATGLRRAWFSDDTIYFAYSDEMSLFLNSRDYGGIGMICYDDPEVVEDIRERLVADIEAMLYF